MVAQPISEPNDDLTLDIEVRGAVARLWDNPSGEIVIAGSAGTGKTYGILEWIHQRCAQERLRVLFLRKTLESLKAAALVTYQEQVLVAFDGHASIPDGVTYFGGNKVKPAAFTYETTGSVITVAGLDNAAKVLSTEYDIVYVNECTEAELDDWEKITGRTDRPRIGRPRPPSLVIGDCNPDAPTHWIVQRANAGKLHVWTSRHEDNPAMWDTTTRQWTPAGLRYLARLDQLTGVRYDRLRLGKWVAAEGLVYAKFDPSVHVHAEDVTGWRTILACDIGSRNPTAILTMHASGDERIHVSHEIYRRNLTSDDITNAIADRIAAAQPEVTVIDPSAKGYIESLRTRGFAAEPAQNDVLLGIQTVQSALARPGGFSIDPSCVNTIGEFGLYHYPSTQRAETDKPVKEDDHGMDSCRYGCMWLLKPELPMPVFRFAAARRVQP